MGRVLIACERSDMAYRALWNHINGKGAWEANPWVAAVSFTVERVNIDRAAPSENLNHERLSA